MFKTFGCIVCASHKARENLYSVPDVFFFMVAGEKEAQSCTFFLDRGMNDGLDVDSTVVLDHLGRKCLGT